MSNVWNITEHEYKLALRLTQDKRASERVRDACHQLCRFYRGQVFMRNEAELGGLLVRELISHTSPQTQ